MLLDTHTLLWFLNNDLRLPVNVRQKIEETELIFVSAVSLWEIAIKINIGKLNILTSFEAIKENMNALNIQELPIEFDDSLAYIGLPILKEHKDPFDRMIVSQAMRRSLTLVSADKKLDAYPVNRLWE
ncbi:type II toxin-antitoxin system VapC family toxin [Pseudanabaena sp. FACHB-1998]|uniref:type II toxin-antitoxin system VapC family toxin n=1 Tax=Pseudanabaena sp. FACHB-1998 TaxID=2692858 RepID=UPI001680645B|nr:type II toxin-antitoxin system VapC family toxin [Pseudanabaena sp. FACHB-1998]MBD2175499.1 type II toxin-antitoxin system VapC family toxin [Pseudanabaena sp. FACHB-1998]